MSTKHQKKITMRPIKEEEVDQFSDLMKYVFQVSKKAMDDERMLIKKKSHQLKPGTALGWFDGDKLISQLVTLPFQVNIHGEIYDMGGVTGVGTYPEYANHGLLHALMKESLKNMREAGQYISYLYPYSIPYYRKKGWEIISDIIEYKIKDTQFTTYKGVSGWVERVDKDHEEIKRVYNEFARKTNGAMIRNETAWNEKFREDFWEEKFSEGEVDLQSAIYYNEDGLPFGYMYYRIVDEIFYIDEIIYLDDEARRGLWNFISAHISMVYYVYGKTCVYEPIAFLLEDSEIKQTIAPYFMGRIVDVEEFLAKFPFKPAAGKRVAMTIDDPLLEWNRGTFNLIWDEEGKLEITRVADGGKAIKLSIQTLTTMMLSYKRPEFLWKIRRITGDEESIALLEAIIPDEEPCFFDYY
ncbi:GNAT family N-acetyltransferase [Bacillus testis]|uniref:GNAT family N-acetyltransferase n=1 Tax=Bacillus testis TaxID=1622072 RepID=UPI0009E293EB|nr:GNAT family N-acetyltransferase [Bacillus testis]